MRAPVVAVTCYDPVRSSTAGDLTSRLERAAADAALTAWVTPAEGTDGAVVVLEVAAGDLGLGPVDDSEGWAQLSAQLGQALDHAAPALALGASHAVLDLDEQVWRTDRLDWCSGRAQIDALDVDQRGAFNALVGRRLVEVRDEAVRWAARPGVPLGVRLLEVPPLPLAASTFEAWTGQRADLTPYPAHVDLAEVNPPTMWLWSSQGVSELADSVAAALPEYEVSVPDDYERFSVVVAQPPGIDRTVVSLLDDLRAVVTRAGPTWAGLLPRGGFLPPGVSPETPGASLVDHLWVDQDWAGPALDEIASSLDGVVPEPVGTGLLFPTGDPTDRAGELLWTPMVRYQRLSQAAGALGRLVQRDVLGPDIRL